MTGAMGNVAHAESAENAELAREVQTGLTGFTGLGGESQNPVNPVNPVKKVAVPRLRFKGCEGAWTKKVLEEIGVTYNGLSGKSKGDFGHGDGRYVTYLGVFNNAVANPKECGAIEIDSSQNEVRDGDVFFTTSSETPDEVGMSSVWRGDGTNTYLNSFCFGYRPNDKIEIDYWARMLRSTAFRKNIIFLAQGISRYNISKRKVMKLCVSLPCHKEQSKIGEYFKWLDQTIGLAESRESSLRQLKRAMLVKMFPRPGQSVPEIRFKGFEGEWEVDFASRIFQTVNIRNRAELPVLSANQERGMIFRNDGGMQITHDRSSEKMYKLVSPGDFVIHLRSFQGGFAHSTITGIASPAYTIMHFRDDSMHDDFYWRYVFTSKDFVKRLELITYGIRDGRSINFSEFSEMSLVFPSLPEQRKIAAFFRNLDRLIGAAEKKVAKLRQVKSSLLERMFV